MKIKERQTHVSGEQVDENENNRKQTARSRVVPLIAMRMFSWAKTGPPK